MGKYKPTYGEEEIRRQSTTPNVSGRSPQDCVAIEESAQRAVAESEQWLLARKMNRGASRDGRSVKDILEEMGFVVLEEYDDLFFSVQPPEGWKKETQGYWTTVWDESGKERISQFFKGAFYDRDAFLNITE
ncbi:MAG TPA: hypothetical protein VK254_00235 [Candidatus Bathyarchaeia archaeon]|nr:hypothetical protein [Candidatus Bathyarchaeia archaeon]